MPVCKKVKGNGTNQCFLLLDFYETKLYRRACVLKTLWMKMLRFIQSLKRMSVSVHDARQLEHTNLFNITNVND